MGKQLCFTGPALELTALFPGAGNLGDLKPSKAHCPAHGPTFTPSDRNGADLGESGEVGRGVFSRRVLRPPRENTFLLHYQAEGSSLLQLTMQPAPESLTEHKTLGSMLHTLHTATLWESLG